MAVTSVMPKRLMSVSGAPVVNASSGARRVGPYGLPCPGKGLEAGLPGTGFRCANGDAETPAEVLVSPDVPVAPLVQAFPRVGTLPEAIR